MDITVNAPSYKRPDNVEVLKYLPFCRIWVCETEYESYMKHNGKYKKNFVKMPKGVQGNISRVRNYMLDNRDSEAMCIVDDDLKYVGYFEKKKRNKIDSGSFLFFLYKQTEVAKEFGVKLWGVNVNTDKLCYMEYTPFSLTSFIGAPFSVHLDSSLRYDERIPLKEDYDFTIQHINMHRKVLRFNKFYYQNRMGASGSGQVGGCAMYRNTKTELEQLNILQKKWGKKIVKIDGNERAHSAIKKKRKIQDLNPVIKLPIKGV